MIAALVVIVAIVGMVSWRWAPSEPSVPRVEREEESQRPMPATTVSKVGIAIRPEAGQQRADDHRVWVEFADGEKIAISARSRAPVVELGEGPIADRVGPLRLRAQQGDDAAAFALFMGLTYCSSSAPTEAALAQSVSRLQRDGRYEFKNAEGATETLLVSDAEGRAARADALHEQYQYCRGLDSVDVAEGRRWLEVAAERGNLNALKQVAQSLGNTQEALKAWQSVWANGDRLGLEFMGVLYSKGVSDGTPDHERAYAFKLLNFKMQEIIGGPRPSGVRRLMLAQLEDDLDRENAALNPQQSAAAVERAKSLLKANPNCCYIP